MRKRLVHPRQAQVEPPGKVVFTFLGGLACDLEVDKNATSCRIVDTCTSCTSGVGAEARQQKKNSNILNGLFEFFYN